MANNIQKFAIVTAGVVVGGLVIVTGLIVAATALILSPVLALLRNKKQPASSHQKPESPTNAIDVQFERLDK